MAGYVKTSDSCTKCTSGCATCTLNATTCTACLAGHYLSKSKCVKCDADDGSGILGVADCTACTATTSGIDSIICYAGPAIDSPTDDPTDPFVNEDGLFGGSIMRISIAIVAIIEAMIRSPSGYSCTGKGADVLAQVGTASATVSYGPLK